MGDLGTGRILCLSVEWCASRIEVVGLYLYPPFFWDFVTGNWRKSFGIGVFFGGEGDSVQGERKGRLGKSYVEVACGDWVESLWLADYGNRRADESKSGRVPLEDMGWL
jgi:hypothetical protein